MGFAVIGALLMKCQCRPHRRHGRHKTSPHNGSDAGDGEAEEGAMSRSSRESLLDVRDTTMYKAVVTPTTHHHYSSSVMDSTVRTTAVIDAPTPPIQEQQHTGEFIVF